jgi:hypothetical protein
VKEDFLCKIIASLIGIGKSSIVVGIDSQFWVQQQTLVHETSLELVQSFEGSQ